ncbi:tail fiber protein [Staphylococcus phage PG-2021_19]
MQMKYKVAGQFEHMYPKTLGDNVNLNNGQTLEQWKKQIDDIYNDKEDSDFNEVWSGADVLGGNSELTILKPLKECKNGWILVFKEPSGVSGNINYCYVPRVHSDLYSTFGVKFLVGVRSGGIRSKFLFITNTTIKGHTSNGTGGNEETTLVKVISY